MPTIRQQVRDMLGKGKTHDQIAAALPHVFRSTLRTYEREWDRQHKPKPKPPDKPCKRQPDTVRTSCGSGARFGPSTAFWRK